MPLAPTEDQLPGAEILQERRKAFDNLGAILRQRDSLLQLQVDTLASFTSLTLEDSDVSSGHYKVPDLAIYIMFMEAIHFGERGGGCWRIDSSRI